MEAGGDGFSARRAVIAALDPQLVTRLAGPDAFPARSLAQVQRYRHGLGTFKVDWALDAPVPWQAEECRRASVVHVGDSVRAMSKAIWEAFYGLLPAQPTLILGQQSLADPSRAPAGKHTLWGYTHVPTRSIGDACSLKPGRTGPAPVRCSRTGWRRPSRPRPWLPRPRPGPPGLEAGRPGGGERQRGRGDINAGSFAIDQQLLFPPGLDWWRWGMPVKGLYLAGASLPPGTGVHGACGDLAARQVLADQHRAGRLAAAAALGGGHAPGGPAAQPGRNRQAGPMPIAAPGRSGRQRKNQQSDKPAGSSSSSGMS